VIEILGYCEAYLEFSQRETSSQSPLGIVLLCSAVNNWPQGSTSRAREDASSFGSPPRGPLFLLRRLIKPTTDTKLPFLVEVGIGDNVVVLDSRDTGIRPVYTSKVTFGMVGRTR